MKKGLSNRRGEVFTATAVKVIIAVVVGVLILGGLFALYRNVIFPKLNQKVEGMIHTEDTVQVRKDGNSVQYYLFNSVILPGLAERIQDMFGFSGGGGTPAGGSGIVLL